MTISALQRLSPAVPAFLLCCLVLATGGAPARADGGGHEPGPGPAAATETSGPDVAPGDETEPATGEARRSERFEEVEVEGQRGGDPAAPTGMASTVVDPEQTALLGDGVAAYATAVPGVQENGQGGLFQTIAIRGLSRQRILQMVDGVRLTSERRAGPSASFLDPLLVGSLDLLRGPASSAYGPGALGGVMQVFPRRFSGAAITTGFIDDGDTWVVAGGGGDEHLSVGVARRDAGDGETADGAVRSSAFTQWSATVQGRWGAGPRRYTLSYLPALGQDIYKPNSDFPDRVTVYPEEHHHILRFAAEGDAGWEGSAWLHPSSLETLVTESDGAYSVVDQKALDLGGLWRQRHDLGENLQGAWGVQTFHRRGVDVDELMQPAPGGGPATFQTSLHDAASDEAGLFGDLGGTWGETEWQAGARFSWIRQSNAGAASRDDTAGSGFFGVVVPLTRRLDFRGHAGTGWRFPTLTERFFTGTTGRGAVIGNPDLEAERSLGFEAGLQWAGRKILFGGSLFATRIDHFIERVEVAPDLLTFVNLTSGTLLGIELEGAWHGGGGWHAGWGGHLIHGRSADDQPLADVSPDRIFGSVGRTLERWGLTGRLAWRAAKNDPGPGEMTIGSATLLSGVAFWRLADAWRLELRGMNLLDEAYFPAADDRAQEAPGRTFGLFVTWMMPGAAGFR